MAPVCNMQIVDESGIGLVLFNRKYIYVVQYSAYLRFGTVVFYQKDISLSPSVLLQTSSHRLMSASFPIAYD